MSGLCACNVADNSVSLYILFLRQSLLTPSKLSAVRFYFSRTIAYAATYRELIQSIISISLFSAP